MAFGGEGAFPIIRFLHSAITSDYSHQISGVLWGSFVKGWMFEVADVKFFFSMQMFQSIFVQLNEKTEQHEDELIL